MNSKIKMVEQYFRDCIKRGQFNVTKVTDSEVSVIVAEEYKFMFLKLPGEDRFCNGLYCYMYLEWEQIELVAIASIYKSYEKENKLKALAQLQKEIQEL